MDVQSALIVLEDAAKRCMTENVNTPDALDFLRARARIRA
jgi:hypothetical protein